MNIVKENIDELNAVLKVSVTPADYQAQVDHAIKDASKKANMPGFRPGKVPTGLVKKMYGKSIMVEQINKTLNETIHKFIVENQLDILGSPIPSDESEKAIDWDNQKEFQFVYELGLAPQFELKLNGPQKFPYYSIKVDEATIDKHIEDTAKRYGKISPQETVEKGDMLFGDLAELGSDGEILPGGVFRSSSLFLERYAGNPEAEKLIGLKKDEAIQLDVVALCPEPAERAALLGVEASKLAEIGTKFRFTLKNCSRIQPAELTPELFDKIYTPGEVTSVEQLRQKVKSELETVYKDESDKRFFQDAIEWLKINHALSLPDSFLKRWIQLTNEKPITLEQIEAEYDKYAESLKWQLIENKLIKDNKIEVTQDEAAEHVRALIRQHYQRYNQVQLEESRIEDTVKQLLADDKESRRIYDQIFGTKVVSLLKDKFTLDTKEVTLDEFAKN